VWKEIDKNGFSARVRERSVSIAFLSKESAMQLKAVLSDLGDVLIPFDNGKAFRAFATISGKSPDEAKEALMGGTLHTMYESGLMSTEMYQASVCDRLGIPPDRRPGDREFRVAYADIFSIRTEVQDEWRRLRWCGATLVAVSNVCEMRCQWIEEMGALRGFDHEVMSFREGLRKPDKELMVRALDRAGAKAEEAIFIDDIAANLGPAAALGIVTHHYTDLASFQKFLQDIGA